LLSTLVVLVVSGGCHRRAEGKPAGGSAAEPALYYAIRIGDALAGYAEIRGPSLVRNADGTARVYSSHTVLRIAMLGQPRPMSWKSEVRIATDSDRLTGYEATIRQGETETRIACRPEGSILRLERQVTGDAEADTAQIEVPENHYFMVGNDFALWMLLARRFAPSPGNLVRVQAVSGEAMVAQSVELKGLEPKPITRGGQQVQARRVAVGGEAILWADAGTGELLRIEIPAQNAVIERADAAIIAEAERAEPVDPLASRFTPSEVKFADIKAVTMLRAEIDVDVTTGAGATVCTDSPMQRFGGRVEGTTIRGTVRVRSTAYDGKDAAPLPMVPGKLPATVRRYLDPEPMIESDDAGIRTQAVEVAGRATTAWEAACAITDWVESHVAKDRIADTPSAKRALATRSGDCGPHATLATAMLRALGVPAKLVGGLMYSPSLAGSFGQHAWVEVFVGGDRWVPVDPMTGETRSLSALHIKCFEGMGGAIPRRVRVLEYEPRTEVTRAEASASVPRLTWELNHTYTWVYMQGERTMGSEAVCFSRARAPAAYKVTSILDLKPGSKPLKTDRTVLLDETLRPISWESSGVYGTAEFSISARFGGRKVEFKGRQAGRPPIDQTLTLPEGCHVFENNCMMAWMLWCSQVSLTPGSHSQTEFFHLETMQVMPLQFDVRAKAGERKVDGKRVATHVIDVAPIGNTFYVTIPDRRFVGLIASGGISIKLVN